MKTWLNRNTESTPLNTPRPRQHTRSTSCGPARDVLERCDVFNTILTIRHDVIVSLAISSNLYLLQVTDTSRVG